MDTRKQFADWYLRAIGITLQDAKDRGIVDLSIMQDAYFAAHRAGWECWKIDVEERLTRIVAVEDDGVPLSDVEQGYNEGLFAAIAAIRALQYPEPSKPGTGSGG